MTTTPQAPTAVAPPQQAQLFDTAHPFITEVPAQLTTELVDGPHGQRIGLTIRIPNTTVTVLLVKDDAEKWCDQLRETIGRANGLILPPRG
jgi:hypothetical protein